MQWNVALRGGPEAAASTDNSRDDKDGCVHFCESARVCGACGKHSPPYLEVLVGGEVVERLEIEVAGCAAASCCRDSGLGARVEEEEVVMAGAQLRPSTLVRHFVASSQRFCVCNVTHLPV